MRKLPLLLLLPLLLVACKPYKSDITAVIPAAYAQESVVVYDSSVLVDQVYSADLYNKKGIEWIRGLQTKKVKGDVSDAKLIVEIDRADTLTGWAAVGMYLGP